jgi:hypothetical protein
MMTKFLTRELKSSLNFFLKTYSDPCNAGTLKKQYSQNHGCGAGAETFGRSRNIEVSAPAPGQLKYFEKNLNSY